jgi:F-type H+-transporting ATPase subunit delta
MEGLRAARRYAEAVLGMSEEMKQVDRLVSDMEVLRNAIKGSREFVSFLKSPVISKDKKRSVLAELFRHNIDESTLGFLDLLIEKNREDVLPLIIEEFFRLRDERMGVVTVDVRAAAELTKEQQQAIEKRFETMTRKSVRMAFSVDKQLKGGFVARVGDTVFDGSLRRQLELLRERFVEETARN